MVDVESGSNTMTSVDVMVGLWRQVLRTDDVTEEDDFFDLGGNSILAVRLQPLIKEHLGAEATISLILDYPTPRELVNALGGVEH
jgi:acyl carrier protein